MKVLTVSFNKSTYEFPLKCTPNSYYHEWEVHAYRRKKKITSREENLILENQHYRNVKRYTNFAFIQKQDLWVTQTQSQWGKCKWPPIVSTALRVSERLYRKSSWGAAQAALPRLLPIECSHSDSISEKHMQGNKCVPAVTLDYWWGYHIH